MGIIRTLLALAVVFGHSWHAGIVFVGGRNAVQMFYIISGFLISYVLVERKTYKSIGTFYMNRYLRLYPIYFVVAAISLLAMLVGDSEFIGIYKKIPFAADVELVFSNTFLFIQDWVMFSGIDHGQLVFASDFRQSEVELYRGLVVPQAWTLGVELTFYLVAPFILPNRKIIWTLLVLSLAVRAYLILIGLGLKDPWTYRFFPAELAFFLIGALAHQILMPFYKKLMREKVIPFAAVATACMVACIVLYSLVPLKEFVREPLLFALFVAVLPFAFIFQNQSVLDKKIGELSYPIYIGHILVIWAVASAAGKVGISDVYVTTAFSVVISILFAVVLNKFVGARFEAVRQELRH
jgi:peptidoglycan/LPS O-acetylase OafA/YrhL